MGNKELGQRSSHQKSTLYLWLIRSQTEASWKGVEKAYSHSILFQFLWFTSDISLLLCTCPQGQSLANNEVA